MSYWLMKSEPNTFSIDDLAAMRDQRDFWDGIRNYQARNFMRDDMQKGDLAFFYHSSCPQPGIVGVMEVIKTAYPDKTAFDPKSKYYDSKSTPAAPRWIGVDVQLKEIFKVPLGLQTLKTTPSLSEMRLVQRGNRLSIMPVTKSEWTVIMAMKDET